MHTQRRPEHSHVAVCTNLTPPPSPLVHVLVSQSSKAYTVPTVLFTSFVVLLPILTLNLLVGTNRLSRG